MVETCMNLDGMPIICNITLINIQVFQDVKLYQVVQLHIFWRSTVPSRYC